jgi:1-acyl-sn-glycerol-3-phosphate acyltransferase
MFLIRIICLLRITYWLVIFALRALLIKARHRDPVRCRHLLAANTTYISQRLLRAFNIQVRVVNPEKLEVLKQENHLVVSNHVSYTDIIVLASCHPLVFITSLEMASNPILGDITKLGGSLFTNRKKHTTLPQEINNFAAALSQGFNVVLFPEGTSTNGASVYDFKKSLFQTALIARKNILPVCIRYRKLNGRPILSQPQRDIICWYATTTFLPHIWRIAGQRIEAEVILHDPIPYTAAPNRQELSELTRSRILESFFS